MKWEQQFVSAKKLCARMYGSRQSIAQRHVAFVSSKAK